ncbi:replication protein [Paenibacillus macerans]|uniref:DnaD domain protein n=1 Tax=Paenibacillus macerans TaxID=44252 RepID=A0A090Y5N0_PAEMA|nr:replication protein [Paenibacillus macerans]KFM93122.1 DnaD domain protein [Paenibacillus macerans]MCY7561578.1 replication protein [Paenibacillus macerans]MEC0153323.1 replication protein [Paenibacillus macerans]SUA84821.1 putative prophage replication protein O [Paenibacillus macerans]
MDSNVNPQPDSPHLRIAHDIHRELIRRKISLLEREVLNMILTLSWGCGKPSAIIPQMKDFELCGVGKGHIRKTIQGLVDKRVIFWEESMNCYQFNKHYDQWQLEAIASFDGKRMNELIRLNLLQSSPNLAKKVPENERGFLKADSDQQKNNPVTEKGTELSNREADSQKREEVPEKGRYYPKMEQGSSRKRNSTVTKKVTLTREFPRNIKGIGDSKTIIKAIKRITSGTSSDSSDQKNRSYDHGLKLITQAYKENFTETGYITPFERADLEEYYHDFGEAWLLSAMREAVRRKQRNLAYVGGILRGYQARGGPGRNSTASKQSQSLEDLDRRIEEERRREQDRSAHVG